MRLLYLAHVLATVLWVGGMFFAHQCLRPALLAQLDGPARLRVWGAVFARFFPWVWASVLVLIGTGHALVAQLGGLAAAPGHVHAMLGVGYAMVAIFGFVYFGPYRRLRRAVEAQDWPAGAAAQDRIRGLVGTNLVLGVANVTLVFVLPLVT